MKVPRRRLLSLGASAAALPILARVVCAQAYPSRPVTIIVPVPPGGVADPIARILADHLSVTLGQPVVVENVPGPAASIAPARPPPPPPHRHTLPIANCLRQLAPTP